MDYLLLTQRQRVERERVPKMASINGSCRKIEQA
jgi:hypothetical protein